MQIVIEIDEERYKDILRISTVQLKKRTPTLEQAIANGIPLSDILRNIRGDIWDAGVNMTGEYQGVWTRFRDVEKAFDKQMEVNE